MSCLALKVFAQPDADSLSSKLKGKQHSVSVGIDFPFGNFSSTHSIGVGVNYAWSHHRFGILSSIAFKPIGFIVKAGGDYFKGKKETIGPYSYKYDAYTYLYAYGGIIINPGKKGNINFTAGPAIGLYSANTQFNIGANLSGSYYFIKNIAVSPSLFIMKESHSDPLWVANFRISIDF